MIWTEYIKIGLMLIGAISPFIVWFMRLGSRVQRLENRQDQLIKDFEKLPTEAALEKVNGNFRELSASYKSMHKRLDTIANTLTEINSFLLKDR